MKVVKMNQLYRIPDTSILHAGPKELRTATGKLVYMSKPLNTRITDIFLPLRLRPCRFRHVLLRGTILHIFLQPNPSEVIKKVTNTYLKVRFIRKCACKDVFVNAQARDCIHLLHFTYMIREPSCEHFPHVG